MKDSVLYQVYTSKEAADKWGLSANTVTQWFNRGKFTDQEARKSAGTIIVTHKAMIRMTGKELELCSNGTEKTM